MATTYRTLINGTTVRIQIREGSTRHFRYVGSQDQCDGCGRDDFRLHRDRDGAVDCLVCEHCEAAYPLREEG